MNLNDLTILITGGSSGIGLAFAEALLERDNRVIICGRDSEKLARAHSRNRQLDTVRCDITDAAEVRELFRHLASRYGQINILINNAGIQRQYKLLEQPDLWHTIAEEFSINLVAQVQLTHHLLPLLSRERGAIVNITSALAVVPKQSAPVYCAAKAGLHSFTRTLRYQLRGTPIEVFEVLPALVDTAMTRDRPEKGKISPQRLVDDALRGITKGRHTIPIERTRLLLLIHRLWPRLAYAILRDS
ncbi:SDR family oxidoreductase [Thiohalomonas denitrificans]|uniref:SDR family oxidoreductase n=1 Tax=Thiohalomonas denitrificans TaxID=415747 RepID=UPI0026EF77B4|nr:SDR family NAD(P)-dependent oxidoreductase [Thiohalomonas denitrificans]